MIYWDTSCVLKLYTAESDSEHWRSVASESREAFASSALLDIELAFALERKERRGDVRPGASRILYRLFRDSCSGGQFELFPIGSDVLKNGVELAHACHGAKIPLPLRTLDAIHLATARLLKCKALVTADQRMKQAAVLFGIPLIH